MSGSLANALKPALRLALRLNEIGDDSPYRLSFAGKGKSGASFGFMQGDLAANQPDVTQTFRGALADFGMSAAEITGFLGELCVPLIGCPLAARDRDRIDAALRDGSARVDAMDQRLFNTVCAALDTCIAAAARAGRTIAPKALIYMALWINMSGPPTKLLTWLGGADPALRRPVPLPAQVVDGPAMEAYLAATDYFFENRQTLPHVMQCAAAGATVLQAVA